MPYGTQKEAVEAASAHAKEIESSHPWKEATVYDFIQNKEVVSGFLAGMEADEKGAQTYKWYNSKTYPYLSRREVDERTMVRK